MKRTLLLSIFCLAVWMTATAQLYDENYFVQKFTSANKANPSYAGIFRKEVQPQLQKLTLDMALEWGLQLPQTAGEMKQISKGHEVEVKAPAMDLSNPALQKKLTDIEKQRTDALKQIDAMPDGMGIDKAALKKEINKSFDQMKAEIPGFHQAMKQEQARIERDIEKENQKTVNIDNMQVTTEMLRNYANYIDDFLAKVTPEQWNTLKEKVRQLALGKKLWVNAKGFRHGRCAVARRVDGEVLWGFIDYNANEVIPCRYYSVYCFNNLDFISGIDGWRERETRTWTTVTKMIPNTQGETVIGMIDLNGREVIPCNFIPHSSGYDVIEFLQTPWGEYARVQEYASKKHGIIDRNGNYTLKPTYEGWPILWDEERKCFKFFHAKNKSVVWFDHKGNILDRDQY